MTQPTHQVNFEQKPETFPDQNRLFAGIDTENISRLTAKPGRSVVFGVTDRLSDGVVDEQERVGQDLMVVIHSGNELFGLVRINTWEEKIGEAKMGYALTRFPVDGVESASLIGRLTYISPLTVGRGHQQGLHVINTNRDQFIIKLTTIGKVEVNDLGSERGTSIVVAKPSNPERQEQNSVNTQRFIRGSVERVISLIRGVQDTKKEDYYNPLPVSRLWSLPPEKARNLIAQPVARVIDLRDRKH